MYYVYILFCEDGSLYTGIARNIEKRFAAHVNGKGAKYTQSHKPVRIVYKERKRNKSLALRREYEIKKLSRTQKWALFKK